MRSESNNVLAVVTNWRRPANVDRIVTRLNKQTVRPTIVVVDNSGDDTPLFDTRGIDDIWRFSENHGPPCRFAPALMDTTHKYTLFVDDDLLPGLRAVEACVNVAGSLGDKFATLGVIGRRHGFDDKTRSHEYRKRNVKRQRNKLQKVDMTARVHFACTRRIMAAIQTRNILLQDDNIPGDDIQRMVRTNDDILLCQGIQRFSGCASYLLSREWSGEWNLREKDLPDGDDTVSSRPHHVEDRSRLINLCYNYGWRSLV